jgi:2-C-methyl-D-erythritol 4-phosphate cytidylyltransferase / 2-C-methyl-D-erythritol 2,4-cyclodiphosphate synthase
MTEYKTIAIIVAAGSGERLNSEIPKQYMSLAGEPILRYGVRTFLNHPQIDAVCVVYNPEYRELYKKAVGDLPLISPVSGGKTRQESVLLGLLSVAKYQPTKILIHDAARPLVDNRIISDIVNSLDATNAVIPTLIVDDTIKICENGKIINTVPRDKLMRAQTPQGFVYKEIMAAHEEGKGSVCTDDASLFESLGKEVAIIKGSQNNFKITSKEDLQRAEVIMDSFYETRVGMGFDAHKFCAPKQQEGNFIMLCGVAIPHDMSLAGHSDADVGIHAAVDAILGAISAGDIGTHFPPSDNQWKGANSSIFLAHAAKLVRESGANIINIDITLICEKPKILPNRDRMCETIAKILDIEKSRVSVKATTTEGMGFTGRKEGIAAQAIANIKVKS